MASLLIGRATSAAFWTTTALRPTSLRPVSHLPKAAAALLSTRQRAAGFATVVQQKKTKPAAAPKMINDHILTLSCPDKSGIVHSVTGLLASQTQAYVHDAS